MSARSTPKAKGLPGFLRRSLRMQDSYEESRSSSDDDDNEDDSEDNDDRTNAGRGTHDDESQEHPLGDALDGTRAVPEAAPMNAMAQETEDASTADPRSVAPFGNQQPPTRSSRMPVPSNNATTLPVPLKNNLKRTVSYKEAVFEKAIGADVVNMSDLRRLGWNGIPPQHRAQAWKLMLGYVPVNAVRRQHTLRRKRAEYKDAMAQHYDIDDDTRTLQEQETLRQVLVDVPRTAPDVPLFRNERIRRSLTRLLYIWAMRHPASSYVQGINDLATPLITVFLSHYFDGQDVTDGSVMEDVSADMMQEIEADCYWCLTNLLAGIQDHYTSDQPGVQRMVMRLEELVTRIDADLTEHLHGVGIEFLQFSFKWMNCLLLREFNLACVMRLWDTYISEGDGGFEDFHVYVCAAFLCQFSSQLQSMEFDELFGFMQHIPTDDWGETEVEILLSQAFVLSTLFGGSDAHLAATQTNRS